MQITYNLNQSRLAALREEIRQTHPEPSESVVEDTLRSLIDANLDKLRDKHRSDFIDIVSFMSRLSSFGKLELILSIAQQNPTLAAYLDRARYFGGVWAGSQETQEGIGSLVALNLLTQAEADTLLYYPLPELPE